jgi:hypothetical protein
MKLPVVACAIAVLGLAVPLAVSSQSPEAAAESAARAWLALVDAGALKSRTLQSATFQQIVTPMKAADGSWRVSGYYIK